MWYLEFSLFSYILACSNHSESKIHPYLVSSLHTLCGVLVYYTHKIYFLHFQPQNNFAAQFWRYRSFLTTLSLLEVLAKELVKGSPCTLVCIPLSWVEFPILSHCMQWLLSWAHLYVYGISRLRVTDWVYPRSKAFVVEKILYNTMVCVCFDVYVFFDVEKRFKQRR